MPVSLGTVRSNFQEIYYDAMSKHPSLVPSLFSGRLYHSRRGFGLFWTVIYFILRPIFTKKWQEQKLFSIIEKTMEAFKAFQANIKETIESYKKNLSLVSEELSFDFKLLQKERFLLTKWNDATLPFLKLNAKKSLDIFHRIKKGPKKTDLEAYIDLDQFEEAIRYNHLIHLERQAGSHIPYAVFSKLSFGKPLKKEEDEALREWIFEFSSQKKCTNNTLHKGLEAFVDHLSHYNSSSLSTYSLPRLEFELCNKGLTLIMKEDQKQLKFQKELKSKDVLATYTLGREIFGKLGDKNKNRVFLLENDKAHVMTIPRNRALCGIKKYIAETYGAGIRFAKFITTDPKGRYQIIQKLNRPLSEIDWKSKEPFDLKDVDFLHPLVGQIIACIRSNTTPSKLKAKYIHFDDEGVLTTVKPTVLQDFNYHALETFAWQVSKNNKTIFQKIMLESKLNTHRTADYFKDVLQDLLRDEDHLSEEGIACLSKHEIIHPKTIRAAKKLRTAFKEMHRDLFKKIMKKCILSDPLDLSRAIYKELISIHENDGSISIILPDLKKRAFLSLKDKIK